MQLFLEHGFDATTTTQIAEEVGISSRSLFRYVATKEDLVLGHLEPQGEVVAAALATGSCFGRRRRQPASRSGLPPSGSPLNGI